MNDLFDTLRPDREEICAGVSLFPAAVDSGPLLETLTGLLDKAPLRQMTTPGGRKMAVSMSSCGDFGWVSGPDGYKYSAQDPLSQRTWPVIPSAFTVLARAAALKAGFVDFQPDSCLINRYEPGTKLSPHQDKDERDFRWPIVSVSLGVPAIFQLYGIKRSGTPRLIKLDDGDVLVFGGPARLFFHGIKKLAHAHHPITGSYRFNLTFRRTR